MKKLMVKKSEIGKSIPIQKDKMDFDKYRDVDNGYLQFKIDLFKHFDVENNPKREACFRLAWDHGHSSGYSEVFGYFCDFVELIEE